MQQQSIGPSVGSSAMFAKHGPSGETYAFRLNPAEEVVEVFGPVYHAEIERANLDLFDYSTEDVEWVREHITAFCPVDPDEA